MPTRVIGSYVRGCIAGAEQMPINGDTWQVMRLSRNRNWGHPDMIALLKRLSVKAHKDAGWPGILVGDIGQPRGGPALSGHASHQIGLDADIWLTPMPDHMLSREEREEMSAVMMVRPDRLDVDPHVFTPGHLAVLRDAAQEPGVQRIFVNAAIKKALCREAKGDRSWLSKIRPWWGHDYHFHIRITCPAGSTRMQGPAGTRGQRRLQRRRSRLLVQGFGLHPEPPKEPPKPSRRSRWRNCRPPAARCWPRRTPSHSDPGFSIPAHNQRLRGGAAQPAPFREDARCHPAVRINEARAFTPPASLLLFCPAMSRSIVSPRDPRNGASACRIPPLTNA